MCPQTIACPQTYGYLRVRRSDSKGKKRHGQARKGNNGTGKEMKGEERQGKKRKAQCKISLKLDRHMFSFYQKKI